MYGGKFYDILMELIEQRGISRNGVEKELGYPRNALSNYEKGRVPSAVRLLELSNYFDVSPEFLMGEKKK